MKKIDAKPGLEYLTTAQMRALVPPGTDTGHLQKYKVAGSRKTYYLKSDVEELAGTEPSPVSDSKEKEEKEPTQPVVLIAYVDGSFNKKTGVYGSAAVITSNGKVIASDTSHGTKMKEMWQVAGEISAAALAVKLAEQFMPDELIIRYDYEGIGKWPKGEWKAKNRYVQEYVGFMNRPRPFSISYEHVKAHSGDTYNEMVDDMAVEAAGLKTMAKKLPAFTGKRSEISEERKRIKYRVCTSCINDIRAFYGKEKHAFGDYSVIRCHETDNLSAVKNIEELNDELTEDECAYIRAILTDEKEIANAARWLVRGLLAEDAVMKTLVDREIYQNKRL